LEIANNQSSEGAHRTSNLSTVLLNDDYSKNPTEPILKIFITGIMLKGKTAYHNVQAYVTTSSPVLL